MHSLLLSGVPKEGPWRVSSVQKFKTDGPKRQDLGNRPNEKYPLKWLMCTCQECPKQTLEWNRIYFETGQCLKNASYQLYFKVIFQLSEARWNFIICHQCIKTYRHGLCQSAKHIQVAIVLRLVRVAWLLPRLGRPSWAGPSSSLSFQKICS